MPNAISSTAEEKHEGNVILCLKVGCSECFGERY